MARGKKTLSSKVTILPKEKQPFSVPENWFWTDIDSINQYSGSSVDPTRQPDTIFELYSVPSSVNDYPEIITGSEIGSSKQSVIKNDVLLCKINPRINRVWKVYQHTNNELVASSEWIVIRNSIANSNYLMFYFRTHYFREFMLSNVSGVGGSLMRAQPKFVKNYPIPIAPIAEQQRIVDRIESLFAKLDEAKEKAQAVVDGFELRKAAILHRAFSGELTERWRKEHGVELEIWKSQALGLVTENHDAKRIPLSQKQRENMNRKYNYYGASGVIDQVEDYLFEGRYLLIGEDGANLVTRSKPIAFIADGQYWVNNHAHVLATKSHMIMDFLCYYINSVDLIPYVTGSAQPKLTQNKMNKIPIPVPSVQEQEKIVYILSKIFTQEQHAKEAAETVLDQIDTMKKAILARAFRGELGTNDPAEEWAGELVREVLKSDIPKQPRAKAVFLPKELERHSFLETVAE